MCSIKRRDSAVCLFRLLVINWHDNNTVSLEVFNYLKVAGKRIERKLLGTML